MWRGGRGVRFSIKFSIPIPVNRQTLPGYAKLNLFRRLRYCNGNDLFPCEFDQGFVLLRPELICFSMNRYIIPAYVIILWFCFCPDASSQPFRSEGDYKKYFSDHTAALAPIEGLWNVNTSQEFYTYDTLYDEKKFSQTVAVLQSDTSYASYDMKGNPFNIRFTKTGIEKVYLFKIYLKEINKYTRADAVITAHGTMQYRYEFPEEYLRLIFKDSYEQGDRGVNKVTWNRIFPKCKLYIIILETG